MKLILSVSILFNIVVVLFLWIFSFTSALDRIVIDLYYGVSTQRICKENFSPDLPATEMPEMCGLLYKKKKIVDLDEEIKPFVGVPPRWKYEKVMRVYSEDKKSSLVRIVSANSQERLDEHIGSWFVLVPLFEPIEDSVEWEDILLGATGTMPESLPLPSEIEAELLSLVGEDFIATHDHDIILEEWATGYRVDFVK